MLKGNLAPNTAITKPTAPMIGGVIVSPGHAVRAFYPVTVMTVAVTFFIVIALAKAARKKRETAA